MRKESNKTDRLSSRIDSGEWVMALGLLLAFSLSPDPAYATAASTLGSVICSIGSNLSPYVDFVSAIAYVAGAFFIGNGVVMLKQHSENPNNAPMSRCVMMMFGGAACMALPQFTILVIDSLFGGANGAGGTNGLSACTPGAPTSISSSKTISMDVMFGNLFNNIVQPMQMVLSALSFVIGAFFVARGLMKAAKFGTDARASSVSAITANLIFGAVLLSAGQMMDVMLNTLFGLSSSSDIKSFPTISWSNIVGNNSSSTTSTVNTSVNAVLKFVQVLGVIFFIQGWMVLKSAVEGSGQASIAKGVTQIIGGAMCVNIGGMAKIMNDTFGLNVINAS
jgi:hypothetical protein